MVINNPLISVCIPTYNREDSLRRCLLSLKSNPTIEVEIVVSDNASNYNIKKLIEEVNDNRIRLICNEYNYGIRANINKIINLAIGRYILFLTDDDIILPNSLEKIKEFILKNKVDAFQIGFVTHLVKSSKFITNILFSENKIFDEQEYEQKAEIIKESNVLTGTCFRKKSIDLVFFNDNLNFWYPSIGYMIFGKKLGYISDILFIHTWENEVFWDVDPRSKELAIDKIEMVKTINIYYPLGNLFKPLMESICLSEINDGRINSVDLEGVYDLNILPTESSKFIIKKKKYNYLNFFKLDFYYDLSVKKIVELFKKLVKSL